MVDASVWGGGTCETIAAEAEVHEEVRWVAQGHWLTIGYESSLADYWRAFLPRGHEGGLTVLLDLPSGITPPTFHFYHLHSSI